MEYFLYISSLATSTKFEIKANKTKVGFKLGGISGKH